MMQPFYLRYKERDSLNYLLTLSYAHTHTHTDTHTHTEPYREFILLKLKAIDYEDWQQRASIKVQNK